MAKSSAEKEKVRRIEKASLVNEPTHIHCPKCFKKIHRSRMDAGGHWKFDKGGKSFCPGWFR